MNDEFELDFNEESDHDNEKRVLSKRKDLDSFISNTNSIRDLSKTLKSSSVQNKLKQESGDLNRTIKNDSPNYNNINHVDQNISNTQKYFFIFYNNNNYNQVKDFLYDKYLKIIKPNHSIFTNKEIENTRSVYFMFVNNDKKLIKALMKKVYIKYDREHKKVDQIKMETKTKQEITFKELIGEYKFSDEYFGRMSLEVNLGSNDADNLSSTSDIELGNGLVMREIRDNEGIDIFEKIRKAMEKKEDYENEQRKRKNKKRQTKSDSSSSSSSLSRSSSKKRIRKKSTQMPNSIPNVNHSMTAQANNPYLMNYFFQFPQYYSQVQKTGQTNNSTPVEQMPYYPFPYKPGNADQFNQNNLNSLNNRNPMYAAPQMPRMDSIMQLLNFHQNPMSPYAMPPNMSTLHQLPIVREEEVSSATTKKKAKKRSKSNSSSSYSDDSKPKKRKYSKNHKSSKRSYDSSPDSNRKKYFDLKHVNNYNELERKNSKNKLPSVNLNDVNMVPYESKERKKTIRKLSKEHSSSSSSEKVEYIERSKSKSLDKNEFANICDNNLNRDNCEIDENLKNLNSELKGQDTVKVSNLNLKREGNERKNSLSPSILKINKNSYKRYNNRDRSREKEKDYYNTYNTFNSYTKQKYNESSYTKSTFKPDKNDNKTYSSDFDLNKNVNNSNRYYLKESEFSVNNKDDNLQTKDKNVAQQKERLLVNNVKDDEYFTFTSNAPKRKILSNFSYIPPENLNITNCVIVPMDSSMKRERKSNFMKQPPSLMTDFIKGNQEEPIISNKNKKSDTTPSNCPIRLTNNILVVSENVANDQIDNFKIINESGKKKIFLNKDRKNRDIADIKIVKRDK